MSDSYLTFRINISGEDSSNSGLLVGASGSVTMESIVVESGKLLISGDAASSVTATGTFTAGGSESDATVEIDSSGLLSAGTLSIIENGVVKVEAGNGKVGSITITSGGSLTGGKLGVGSGGTLTITMGQEGGDEVEFTASSGVIDVAGTLNLVASGVDARFEIASGATLTATSGGEGALNSSQIKVSGDESSEMTFAVDNSVLKDYLDGTATGTGVFGDAQSGSGAVLVLDKGTLEITTSSENDVVTLDNYNFSSGGSAGSGVIGISGGTLYASKMQINSTLKNNTSSGTFVGTLKADELTVGNNITIIQGSNGILGAGSGSMDLVVTNALTTSGSTFTVNSDLTLGDAESDSAGSWIASGGQGTIIISGDSAVNVQIDGNFEIEAGTIEFGNSGTVTIGGNNEGNATVTFAASTSALTLTAAATTGTSTISVKGTVGEDGDVSATTTLDLTAVTNFSHDTSSGGLVSLIAEEGGIIEVSGGALSNVLSGSSNVGASGFAFVLSGASTDGGEDGKLYVSGDLTATVSNLRDGSQTVSGYAVNFSGGGVLEVDGTLTLTSGSSTILNIGSGSIVAKSLALTNYSNDASSATGYTLSGGTVQTMTGISSSGGSGSASLLVSGGDNASARLILGDAEPQASVRAR